MSDSDNWVQPDASMSPEEDAIVPAGDVSGGSLYGGDTPNASPSHTMSQANAQPSPQFGQPYFSSNEHPTMSTEETRDLLSMVPRNFSTEQALGLMTDVPRAFNQPERGGPSTLAVAPYGPASARGRRRSSQSRGSSTPKSEASFTEQHVEEIFIGAGSSSGAEPSGGIVDVHARETILHSSLNLQTQTNMVVSQIVEDRQKYHQERDEIAQAVRDVQNQQQAATSSTTEQQRAAASEIEARIKEELGQKLNYADQQVGEAVSAQVVPSADLEGLVDPVVRTAVAVSAAPVAHLEEDREVQADRVDLEIQEKIPGYFPTANSWAFATTVPRPKSGCRSTSELDKTGTKYDSRDLARFNFNKDALVEVQAKDMRNTKSYANQLRLAIGSMMSQGSILEMVHEQFLVGRFLKYCHDDTATKLMKQRRIIRDDVEDSWSFDNYMRLVCVENPAKTITLMDCVREWSLKYWKKRGSVSLLTELIRIEDTANDCGFTLCGARCTLMQKLMIWEEIICRVDLPKGLERDIKRLTRRPVVIFEELKQTAVNDQDLVTMEEVRNSDRTVTTIKELQAPTINELQTWFPDASETEINALYPKFGAGRKPGGKPTGGGRGGASSSSGDVAPYFPGKCARCGQIGHMARHCKQNDSCNICGATDRRSFNCPNGNIGDKQKPEVALARFARKQKGKGKARQEQRLVHGYRRVHYGVSNFPANRGGRFPDSRAATRVTRDLDQPFGDFLEIDYSFQVKNNFLISRPLDRIRSIVVDYFFVQEETGTKPIAAPYLFDLPINEEYFQPPLNERFYAMLRPPLSYNGVRVVSLQRGDSVPETLSQKFKLHHVPKEFFERPPGNGVEGGVDLLPSPLQEFEGKFCGVAKCVVDRVKAVPAYENFRREVERTISEKGTIAIIVGDGVLDNVAIVESLKDKVHKNRIRHCSLTWGVDLLLMRITCTGELVPHGVTERTEAELKFDEINRCCRKDPRFGLSRKQLFAFGVAKAIARRTGERGMTKVELMLEAAKQLRRFRYEDVEKACDAVMLTSTRHFRYSANPLRMVRGTWLGVDVRAVSKLDTTFLMEPWSDVGLAVVNVINCFDKQAYGEVVGPKRIVCKSEKTTEETKTAVNAVLPGVDLAVGHPNGVDVTRVASMAMLLQIILMLLIVDPGPENIARALALMMLGSGRRLRIASGNSARYMAMIERLQLTLKTQLESYRHDPYLSKLYLNVQVILCHMVRNERIRQSLRRTLDPASQRLELMASLPITSPESDSLVFWDEQSKQLTNADGEVIAADGQAVERARIRMGMQLVDKEFQTKMAKLKDQIEKDISQKGPLFEGDLVRYKTKSDDQEPATVVNPVPNKEGKVLAKPLGAASKALPVARRFCQKVVDTDLSYVARASRYDRVSETDEEGKQAGRQRVGFEDEPEVRVYDPAEPAADAPEDANDLFVDPAEEGSDEVWENRLPAEEEAEPPQPDIMGMGMQLGGGGAVVKEMQEPHIFDLSVHDLEDIVQVQQVRVNQMELERNPNVRRLDKEVPMTFRDERVDWDDPVICEAKAVAGNKRFEQWRNWIVDDSIFVPSLHSREPSSMARSIVLAYDKTGGPNVEDDEWSLFLACLTKERCWYLDEVSTVWGESEVKRFDPTKVTGDHPERRAFTVFIHKLGEDHFVFSRSKVGAYGAARFEVDAREAVAKDEAKERIFNIHREGFTAGMRKKLRKGNKLPDFVPEDLIKGKLNLREYMVHALVKELRGTITGTSSEGVPCVVIAGEAEQAAEAAGVLHSGEKPLTSRFPFDIKFWAALFVILKCRWAPGGHMSSKERLELSENGSPTPTSLELKLCLFAGNAMRVPRPLQTDVPRAFNDSIQYAQHERPRTKITHRGPVLDAVIEEAMAMFNELEGLYISFDSEFVVNIAQYGSLEGAVVFWLSNRYKFRKNQIMPSLSSPCVFRVHDEMGKLIVVLLEFVDDFLGMVEAALWDWVITKLGTIYPRLTADLFLPITDQPSTVIGREASFHTVSASDSEDGRPEIYMQVDARNKVGALAPWQSDDEIAKRKGDLDRLVSPAETERLRSVRGECLYVITDWRPDCVYSQKIANFGNDESRTVRYAARQNYIVELLKKNHQLGIRIRLDLGMDNLIFILLVDAGFQARPHKAKTDKDAPDARLKSRGVMELLEKESQDYSDAKLTNMRAMTAYGLFVTSESEFKKSAADKTPMRGSLLDHGLEHSDDLATSSGSGEMGGYLSGIEHSEIAKRKLQDIVNKDGWAGVERRQKKEELTWDETKEEAAVLSEDPGLILDLAKAEELDLLDSEVVIRRTLSRNIAIKENEKVFYLREMMCGRFHWYKSGDKKQTDRDGVFGVLRENTRECGADPRARKPALLGMK
eukprot:g13433.t1